MRSLRRFFPCLAQEDQVITAPEDDCPFHFEPLQQKVERAKVQVDVAADGQTIELNDFATMRSEAANAAQTHSSKPRPVDWPSPRPPINADEKDISNNDHHTENNVSDTKILGKGGSAGLRRRGISPANSEKYISPIDAARMPQIGAKKARLGRYSRRLFDPGTEWTSLTVETPEKLPSPTSVMDIPTVTPTSSCFGECGDETEEYRHVLPQEQLSPAQSDESEEEPIAVRSPIQHDVRTHRIVSHLGDELGDKKRGYHVLLDEDKEKDDIDQLLEKTNCLSPETRSFVKRVQAEQQEVHSSPLNQQTPTAEKGARRAKYKQTHDGLLGVVCQISKRCADLQSSLDERHIEMEKMTLIHKRLVLNLKAAKAKARKHRDIAQKVIAANVRRHREEKEAEEVMEKLLSANNKLETALQAMKESFDSTSAERELELNEWRKKHASLETNHFQVCQDMQKSIAEIEELKKSKHDLEQELECTREMYHQEAAERGKETLSHVYEIMDLSRDYDARVADLKKRSAELEEQNEAQKLKIDELKMSLELMRADADYASAKFERTNRKHRHEINSLTKESEERFFEVMVARGKQCEEMRLSLQDMFDTESKLGWTGSTEWKGSTE